MVKDEPTSTYININHENDRRVRRENDLLQTIIRLFLHVDSSFEINYYNLFPIPKKYVIALYLYLYMAIRPTYYTSR